MKIVFEVPDNTVAAVLSVIIPSKYEYMMETLSAGTSDLKDGEIVARSRYMEDEKHE